MATFTVRIVNDDEEGIRGVQVRLSFRGLTRGMSVSERTDSDGRAEFSGYDEGEVTVYVDGSDRGEFYYKNGDEITISI